MGLNGYKCKLCGHFEYSKDEVFKHIIDTHMEYIMENFIRGGSLEEY